MGTLLCITDWASIISAVIGAAAVLFGVWFSIKKWEEEKILQRINERKELLTKLVGTCLGNLDFVILQYRKFQNNPDIQKWQDLQTQTEQFVKEAEEMMNEAELKINEKSIISELHVLEDKFVNVITSYSKEGANIENNIEDYRKSKKKFIDSAKGYLRSYNGKN